MTLTNTLIIITSVIGSATLIFRGLLILTKLTTTTRDDKIVKKILKVLELLSMNVGIVKNEIVVKVQRGK